MRGENLLVGMTQIDDSLIAFAESYNGKKKKNYRKSIIRAASVFLLLSAAVVFAIISHGKRYEFNADGKINIFSMPGAVRVSTSEKAFCGDNGNIYLPDEYADMCRNSDRTIIYGTAKNINTVSIADGDRLWYITTFEIEVIDAVKDQSGASVIKAASVSCYENDDPHFLGMLASDLKIHKEPTGLFVLKSAHADEYEIGINGKRYSAYEFADLYAMAQYDCDGKSFDYYGTEIALDSLRAP